MKRQNEGAGLEVFTYKAHHKMAHLEVEIADDDFAKVRRRDINSSRAAQTLRRQDRDQRLQLE